MISRRYFRLKPSSRTFDLVKECRLAEILKEWRKFHFIRWSGCLWFGRRCLRSVEIVDVKQRVSPRAAEVKGKLGGAGRRILPPPKQRFADYFSTENEKTTVAKLR
jgi:hypothetical protein